MLNHFTEEKSTKPNNASAFIASKNWQRRRCARSANIVIDSIFAYIVGGAKSEGSAVGGFVATNLRAGRKVGGVKDFVFLKKSRAAGRADPSPIKIWHV